MIEILGAPPNDVAKWVGWTASAFSISQCFSAVLWGRLSDKYGRKKIILAGLINTMIATLIWGFATTIPMAIAARVLSGAGNGNAGILRTVVAELVPWAVRTHTLLISLPCL